MKKVFCIMVIIALFLNIIPIQVFAKANNDINDILTTEFIENADISYKECQHGEYVISFIYSYDFGNNNKEEKVVNLFYDSEEAFDLAVAKLNAFKETSNEKGSGTYTESGSFYNYSLYISSTVHYTTTVSSNIMFGRITSVDISCQTNSGTTIDNISIYAGEIGYAMGGGYKNCNKTYNNVSNNSTTNFPSTWPYVEWDSSVGSSAGAHTTVTIHRGTAAQRSYTLSNNVIG